MRERRVYYGGGGDGIRVQLLGRDYVMEDNQLRLLDEVCPICGRDDVLFVPYGDGFACVDCVAKENGEDDESDSRDG